MRVALFFITLSIIGSIEANNTSDFIFNPPNHSQFIAGTSRGDDVYFNISDPLRTYASYQKNNGHRYFAGIIYDFKDVWLYSAVKLRKTPRVIYLEPKQYNLSQYFMLWPIQLDNEQNSQPIRTNDTASRNAFQIRLDNIGYPKFAIEIIEYKQDRTYHILDRYTQVYYMISSRKQRGVDLGFNVATTIIGLLNIFAIGCVTDMQTLRLQLKESIIPVCIAAGTQYIITPLVSTDYTGDE